MLLTVVDYGVGNLRSIAKSIEKANSDSKLNFSVKVSSDINDVKKSDKIETFEKDLRVKKPWIFND